MQYTCARITIDDPTQPGLLGLTVPGRGGRGLCYDPLNRLRSSCCCPSLCRRRRHRGVPERDATALLFSRFSRRVDRSATVDLTDPQQAAAVIVPHSRSPSFRTLTVYYCLHHCILLLTPPSTIARTVCHRLNNNRHPQLQHHLRHLVHGESTWFPRRRPARIYRTIIISHPQPSFAL